MPPGNILDVPTFDNITGKVARDKFEDIDINVTALQDLKPNLKSSLCETSNAPTSKLDEGEGFRLDDGVPVRTSCLNLEPTMRNTEIDKKNSR